MSEAYAEWLVKRKASPMAFLWKIGMAVICVAAFFAAVTMGILGLIIFFAVAFATYLVFRNSEVEFEYLYVSNQLTIDRIYGKAKRKKAWEGSMDEIKIIAPTGAYQIKDHETKDMKTLDFTSHAPEVKTFTLISQSGAQATRILFEPNEKMLHCFKMTAPSKVIEKY